MMAGAGGAMRATGWRATAIRFQQFGEGVSELITIAALTRAREARADSSELSELRRAERPARAGAAAAGRRRHFFLADCCSQIRR